VEKPLGQWPFGRNHRRRRRRWRRRRLHRKYRLASPLQGICGKLRLKGPCRCPRDDQCHPWVCFLYRHLKDGALRARGTFNPWLSSLPFASIPEMLSGSPGSFHDELCKTPPELGATAALLIVAGSEGMFTQMTATTNYLSRSPWKLKKLAVETQSKLGVANISNPSFARSFHIRSGSTG
jgi:hypothetical protein